MRGGIRGYINAIKLGISARINKRFKLDFASWVAVSQMVPYVVFLFAFVIKWMSVDDPSVKRIIQDLTSHGEYFVFCIPLFFSLMLDFHDKGKNRPWFKLFFSMLSSLLLIFVFCYSIVSTEVRGKVDSIRVNVLFPFIALNGSAFVIMMMPKTIPRIAKNKKVGQP